MYSWGQDFRALADECRLNVLMLDHSPEKAAAAHVDAHVRKMLPEVAQVLSNAWHTWHNPAFQDWEAETPYAELMEWVVPPAMFRERTPCDLYKDGIVRRGDAPFYLLAGQRILHPADIDASASEWCAALGGNYRWAWRLAMALLEEHRKRFGGYPTMAPRIWALEMTPPALVATEAEWSEISPQMPEEYKIVDGGFYDTVASYRNWYARGKVPLWSWSGRPAPAWLASSTVRKEAVMRN